MPPLSLAGGTFPTLRVIATIGKSGGMATALKKSVHWLLRQSAKVLHWQAYIAWICCARGILNISLTPLRFAA